MSSRGRGYIGAVAFALAFGALTAAVLSSSGATAFDRELEAFVSGHRVEPLLSFMRGVTWLGSVVVLGPLVIVLASALVVRERDRVLALLGVGGFAGAVALNWVAKGVADRMRPPVVSGFGPYAGWSFPSGHSTQVVVGLGIAALVMTVLPGNRRRWLWPGAAFLVLLVGASRVYLGAYWATDVLGGFALGGTWLSLFLAGTARWRTGVRGRGPGRGAARPPEASPRNGLGQGRGNRAQLL
ncbi:hypothetical protein BH20ACT24_BH20ACT24_21090 [soil metagenome]